MSKRIYYDEEIMPTPWQETWALMRKNHWGMLGLAIVAMIIGSSLLLPLLLPYSAVTVNPNVISQPPVWQSGGAVSHLFGTDELGRDLLVRLFIATQLTLLAAFAAVFLSLASGLIIGVLAALYDNPVTALFNRFLNTVMTLPTIILAIMLVALLGVGLLNAVLAVAFALLPRFIHSFRDFIKNELSKTYVTSSYLDGAKPWHVFFYVILPNMTELLCMQFFLALTMAITEISALGFLDLGAQTLYPELGTLLADGVNNAYTAPWGIIIPGIWIFLLVYGVNLVGNNLVTALKTRLGT